MMNPFTWFRRSRLNDVSDEIRSHIEEKTDEFVASGMSRADAEAAARRAFGNVVKLQETARDVWRFASFIESLATDVRYALRGLAQKPGFTIAVILTLALGIGANTAIFSVVNAVVLRPLPFAEPKHLVWLWDTQPQLPTAPASLPDFLDWKEQNRSFEYLAAFLSGNTFLNTGDGTRDTPVGVVTPEMFALFRVRPILGRTFTAEETLPGRSRVAVLSHGLWQSLFGSDPNVLG